MSWADDPSRAAAAGYGIRPELAQDGGMVANVTSTVENDDWVLIGDATILALTIVGALSILISMAVLEFRGRPSTTRTRLVQALILSDFLLGIVGLVGVSLALQPGGLQPGQACNGLSVVLVAILWSEHLWTMALAIATFLILILPLHPLTLLLEKHWWVLLVLIWSISFAVSAAGYGAYGAVPSGGICYYPSSSGLFGPLMHAFVFLVITGLYAKLFVFLRRPDKIRSAYSNSPTGSFQQRSARIVSAPLRPIGVISTWFRRAPPEDYMKEVVLERIVSRAPDAPAHTNDTVAPATAAGATAPAPAPARATATETPSSDPSPPQSPPQSPPRTYSQRRSHPTSIPPDEIPPWEKVELPAFQIDGQRFGGAGANQPSTQSSTTLWSNWKGLGGGSARESRKRPSTSTSLSHSPPAQSTRKFGSGSSIDALHFATMRTSPTPVNTPRLDSVTSMHDPLEHRDEGHLSTNTPNLYYPREGRGSLASTAATGPSERFRQFSLTPSDGAGLTQGETRRGSAVSASSRRSSGQASPLQKTREMAPILSQPSLRDSEETMAEKVARDKDEKGHGWDRRDTDADPERFGKSEGEGDERGEHEEEDDNWDLMRMLQQSGPPKSAADRFAPAQGETIELVEESMASYLNRKTALLMLWFPLGYVMLFSVSLVRIIYDFVGTPPTALRAISRWFIFAQGILDALIYGLVEWHTKRVVRRRVKKGTLSPTSHSAQSGSWPRALLSRRTNGSQNATATGANGGSMSQLSTSMSMSAQGQGQKRDTKGSTGRQNVTFGRIEERSFLREMDLLEEKDMEGEYGLADESRRGSAGVDSVDTRTTARSGVSAVSGMSGTSGSSSAGDTTNGTAKIAGTR